MGNTNKNKGSAAERKFRLKFEELGWKFCKTSRQANRLADDCGVDLVGLPFNVQVKAGHQEGMSPQSVLQYIDDRLPEAFAPHEAIHTLTNVLIFETVCGRGKKRRDVDTLVFIAKEDFNQLLKFTNNVNNSYHISKVGNKVGWDYKSSLLDENPNTTAYFYLEHTKYKKADKNTTKYHTLCVMSFETFAKIITNGNPYNN